MKLTDSQLIEIIENIPSIEVSLQWLRNEGTGSFDKEVEAGLFTISTTFSCYESGTSDAGDYHTPPSFVSSGLDIFDIEVNIFNQDGEELTLSTPQQESIEQAIKSNIISI